MADSTENKDDKKEEEKLFYAKPVERRFYVKPALKWATPQDMTRKIYFHDSDVKLDFDNERHNLQKQLTETIKELNEAKKTHKETKDIFFKLEQTYSELEVKEKINHILSRINENGRQKVLNSPEFLDLFQDKTPCESVVVSIDIRRSTELMLKARRPDLFSEFITELSHQLSDCIINNFGIFDKFTGDGILAFFPKFYSGDQAIVRAIQAANECHRIFQKHYNNSRGCFSVFIKDVGLGIGIDYGNVTLVNTTNELTVVGIPVVYACRMSGAEAGKTILNQPAKEEVERLNKNQAKFIETEINIKNEGNALAYIVELNSSVFKSLENPEWMTENCQKNQEEVSPISESEKNVETEKQVETKPIIENKKPVEEEKPQSDKLKE